MRDDPKDSNDEFEEIEYIPEEPVTEAEEEALSPALKRAAKSLPQFAIKSLVRQYYMAQGTRLRVKQQFSALSKVEEAQDTDAIKLIYDWAGLRFQNFERDVKVLLSIAAKSHPVGKAMLTVSGIGPVMTAGFLAHIDVMKQGVDSAGSVWRFAGLDPTLVWDKGQRRPFNASLKVLCFLAGKSFVLVSNREGAYYGALYRYRKEWEARNNLAGAYADQAVRILATRKFDPETLAYKSYSAGMLPAAHVDMRARRYATKQWLADVFVALCDYHGKWFPAPYAVAHLDHAHYHLPPWWDMTHPLPSWTGDPRYRREGMEITGA